MYNKDIKDSERPIVFINALHHAREPLSLSVLIYTIFQICHKVKYGDDFYINLLKWNKIFVVPVINVDSYRFIIDNIK